MRFPYLGCGGRLILFSGISRVNACCLAEARSLYYLHFFPQLHGSFPLWTFSTLTILGINIQFRKERRSACGAFSFPKAACLKGFIYLQWVMEEEYGTLIHVITHHQVGVTQGLAALQGLSSVFGLFNTGSIWWFSGGKDHWDPCAHKIRTSRSISPPPFIFSLSFLLSSSPTPWRSLDFATFHLLNSQADLLGQWKVLAHREFRSQDPQTHPPPSPAINIRDEDSFLSKRTSD